MAILAQLLKKQTGVPKGMGAPLKTYAGYPDAFVPSAANLDPKRILQPGMYDPALDWQQQSENLGYGQNVQDTSLGGSRLHEQIFGGSGFYANPVTGQRSDYATPGALAQLAQSRQRGDEDYRTATGNVQRQYHNLETAQGGQARAAGVSHGGALTAALQARSANQARDQSGLDTSWRRMVDDNNVQRNTILSGAAQGQQGLDIGAARAGAANTLFNQQIGEAKVGSAQQMGTLPELPAPEAPQAPAAAGRATSAAFARMGVPSSTPTFTGPDGTFIRQPAVGGGFWHIYENGKRVKVKA